MLKVQIWIFDLSTIIANPKNKYSFETNINECELIKNDNNYLLNPIKTIEILNKDDDGFFLMIEGSQIDWGGHENNYEYMKTELFDLNETMNAILDYAEQQGDVLVVVTADHETGGLSLHPNKENKKKFTPNYSTGGHSGIMVPVFAFGPGAENFGGIYENTEVHFKFKKLLGLE